MSRLFKDFTLLSLGNYGGIVVSFGINVLLTRRLGAEGFGHLALFLMASQILSFFVANWTVAALVRFGAQEFLSARQAAKAVWARTAIVAPWLLLAGLGVLVFRDQAAAYLRVSTWGVALVFAHFVLASLLVTQGALLQACGRMGQYAVALFMDKLLTLAALLLLPSTVAGDPLVALGCYVGGAGLVSIWAIGALGVDAFRPIRLDRAVLREMWRFSLPMIATTWVSLLGTYWIDYVVITKFLSLSHLGLYSLANQVAGVVQQMTIISSSILLPHFSVLVAQGDLDGIRRFVTRIVPMGFLALSVLLGLFILHAGPLLPLAFGQEFAASTPPLAILMVATSLLAFYNTFTPLLTAQGATWTLMWITLPTATVNIATDLLFVPWLGINGAALSTVLAYATSSGLVLLVAGRRLGQPLLANAFLGLPVVLVVLCVLFLDGLTRYATGLLVLGVSSWLLARLFRLGRSEELTALLGAALGSRFGRKPAPVTAPLGADGAVRSRACSDRASAVVVGTEKEGGSFLLRGPGG